MDGTIQRPDSSVNMIPLTPAEVAPLPDHWRVRIDKVARDLLKEGILGDDQIHYGHNLLQAPPRGAAVHLDDLSEFPLIKELPGYEGLQFRARLRAEAGEYVVTCMPESAESRSYYAEQLHFSQAHWLQAGHGIDVARQAWSDDQCFATLVRLASNGEGIYLHPYIATQSVWNLAWRLTEASGQPIPVLGPLPSLCDYLNDKLCFMDLATRLLGSETVVKHASSNDPYELAHHLGDFAHRYDQLALRLTDCTAGGGTRIFSGASLRHLTPEALHDEVLSFLAESCWDGQAPLMLVEWLPAEMSPSTQLWIPAPPEPVICEGIFEQHFFPAQETRFAGGVQADLPPSVERPMVEQSIAIGTLLQRLGYRGRCSLDTIVLGGDSPEPQVYFIECNARWGGISIPMTLMNRLFGDHRKIAYLCGAQEDPKFRELGFNELRHILKNHLHPISNKEQGVVMYNVECLGGSDRFDVVCYAKSLPQAKSLFDKISHLLRNH